MSGTGQNQNMIFFGTRGVHSNAGQGHFHCP
ncbi:uncharacterized protein METZ01_LOCUS226136, partial [marine metagenome]